MQKSHAMDTARMKTTLGSTYLSESNGGFSLPFFGFVLCFLVNKRGFFSSNRVARLSSAYDFGCVVTSCDLLFNESCVFLAFIIRLLTPSIPAGFDYNLVAPVATGRSAQ